MQGLMMDYPLTITSLMRHADQLHRNSEIVSLSYDNPRHRYRYADCFRRVRQLANALAKLGVSQGDVIGTLAWNDHRHFEIYYAVACSGAVCHTINPRLFADQIEFIVNHAEDRWIFVDPTFVPLLEPLHQKLENVQGYIVMTDAAHMPSTSLPNVHCYEDLIAPCSDEFDWPVFDENTACSLCYTSGTTGNPKGVLYSHRALILHTYAGCLPDTMGVSMRDTVLPIVPMFHVNAWNLPYAAALVGFKLVMPGSHMGNPETLQQLIEEEQVSFSAGVPTVWLGLLNYLRESGKSIDSLERVVVGGSACPLSIMEAFDQHGVYTHCAWGMTEMSPMGTVNVLMRPRSSYSDEEFAKLRLKAGRPVYGVELKIVDDENRELPWNGVAFGALKVRGPWICASYFKMEDTGATDADGWFDTGDVATIDADGYMQITDRTKDVIKSGGEWISSIDLENTATGHPAVAEAAVIGIPHPKWDERPLLIVKLQAGSKLEASELLDWMSDKVARWWLPNDVAFVDELPHTATGKLQKVSLREQFADYSFPADKQ
jgi:fatty-acyl-CoA synthase